MGSSITQKLKLARAIYARAELDSKLTTIGHHAPRNLLLAELVQSPTSPAELQLARAEPSKRTTSSGKALKNVQLLGQ